MSVGANLYDRFRWSVTSQYVEHVDFDELDEIGQIARAIADTNCDIGELYTTTEL